MNSIRLIMIARWFLVSLFVVASRSYATPWTPALITTEAWYDASDTDTITEVTNAVSQWDDKSGNNRNISQTASTNQPVYTSDSVSFDGTSQMLTNGLPFMWDNGEIDIYVVAKGQYTTFSRLVAEGSTGDANPFYALVQCAVDGTLESNIRSDGGSWIVLTEKSAQIAGVFDDTKKMFFVRDSGTNFYANVNGSTPLVEGDTYSRTSLTPNIFSVGGMVFGTNTRWMDADVNEIVITDNLSDADRQKMEGYLAWKWGLKDSLPGGHPYRNMVPGTPDGAVLIVR